ncbi:MAG TPA: hypothetical protein VFO41_10520 [Alphaproteobacteria bacterium]|nr:hypothetical protein [Alphaproteobacteria bacterium]
MACINPDGTLSEVAKAVLTLLRHPHEPTRLAAAAGLPLYRVRATLRETGRARLVSEEAGVYRLTELGEEALELDDA